MVIQNCHEAFDIKNYPQIVGNDEKVLVYKGIDASLAVVTPYNSTDPLLYFNAIRSTIYNVIE